MANLNENQQKAVYKVKGPLRIIAGPGSGKTKTIISKISYLLENGLAKPNEILTITFTNKAANEIKKRVLEECKIQPINIFTYHGWCHYFLRKEAKEIELNENFIILDSTDSRNMITKILKNGADEFTIEKKEALNYIEKIAREEILDVSDKNFKIEWEQDIKKIWNKYCDEKKINGQFDFNDLLTEVRNVLKSNEKLCTKWKNKYKYLFVDEFQDTNNIQFEIIRLITNNDSNITIVGDPDQNIYSWRGANINLINNFSKWYPSTETIMLNLNYRSTPEIVKVSNSLISHNRNRYHEFNGKAVKENNFEIETLELQKEDDEGWETTKRILLLFKEGYSYKDIAIIVRSSYKTRGLEVAMNHNKIPYKIIGAKKFFERSEIKQVLKFMFFISQQNDQLLLEIINDPPKKFGPKKIQKTQLESEKLNISIWEYLKKNIDEQPVKIAKWIDYTKKIIEKVSKIKGNDFSFIFDEYLEEIDYKNSSNLEDNKIKNVNEFIKIINDRFTNVPNKNLLTEIKIFYNDAILSSSSDEEENENVTILTAHAAKGTEFPIVFIYSFNEGHLPSRKVIEENKELEEERRVAYVAITRAMERLILIFSNGINYYGKLVEESRFLKELFDEKTYNKVDINEIKANNLNTNSKIGSKILHKTFGIGEIIGQEDDVINVKFENGMKQEILLGHKSYKIIEK